MDMYGDSQYEVAPISGSWHSYPNGRLVLEMRIYRLGGQDKYPPIACKVAEAIAALLNGNLGKDAQLDALRERAEKAESEAKMWKDIIEEDASCMPGCDGYSHEEGCLYANFANRLVDYKKRAESAEAALPSWIGAAKEALKRLEVAEAERDTLKDEVERLKKELHGYESNETWNRTCERLVNLEAAAREVIDSPEQGDGFGGYSVSEESMKSLRSALAAGEWENED